MSKNFRPIGHEDHHILRNEKDEHGIWRQVCSCGKRLTLADYPMMIYTKTPTDLVTGEQEQATAVTRFSVETDQEERLKGLLEEIVTGITVPTLNLKRLYEEDLAKAPMFRTGYDYSPLPDRHLIIDMNDI